MLQSIRRGFAIVRTTALEMSSEPLSLMLTLAACVSVALCSALHFHQFGEASRMARDAGISAILIFGILHAVFCTIKVFRREIESGTLQMALAHPVSRAGFFLAKAVGALVSSLLFVLTVLAVVRLIVVGAELGFWIARVKGDIPLVWDGALWAAAAVVVTPLVAAAALDRFAHFRFTLSASVATLVFAWVASAAVRVLAVRRMAALAEANRGLVGVDVLSGASRLLPAAVAVALVLPVFVFASAAFAVRLKDHAAATLAGVFFALALPGLGSYYLSDALAKGGTIPWSYVGFAALATLPFVLAFALLGLLFFRTRDVG